MNGLLIQWGENDTDSDGGANITFINYTDVNTYRIFVTAGYNTNTDETGYKISSRAKGSLRIGIGTNYANVPLNWLLIGY